MKNIKLYISLFVSVALAFSCSKDLLNSDFEPMPDTSEVKIDTTIIKVSCGSNLSSGKVMMAKGVHASTRYEGDAPNKYELDYYVQFKNEDAGRVEITHKPNGVNISFTTINGITEPNIKLEDTFDEKGKDNYVDFIIDETPSQDKKCYRLIIERPTLNVGINYVYEKDSVNFLCDGLMVELPSKETGYMLSYGPYYEFASISSNTYILETASAEWIQFLSTRRFKCSPNEGVDTRVGHITFSDITGERTKVLKITQEGTGWQDRQNEVLWEFYNATGGPEWKNNNGWVAGMAATAPRAGIGFNDNGRVTEILLSGNGLTGTLPKSFGELWAVNKIDLYNNELSGPIPDCLGKLHCVRWLYLDRNQFTGTLPESMKGLTAMTSLFLSDNKLSGVIPDWLFELPRFVDPPYEGYGLCLGDNYFSNYDPAIHCTHNEYWQHEDGGNHGGKTPDGFNQGGSVEENF